MLIICCVIVTVVAVGWDTLHELGNLLWVVGKVGGVLGWQGVLPIRKGLKVWVIATLVTVLVVHVRVARVCLGDWGQVSVVCGRVTDRLGQICGRGVLMVISLVLQRLHLMVDISGLWGLDRILLMLIRTTYLIRVVDAIRVYLIVVLELILAWETINSLSSPTHTSCFELCRMTTGSNSCSFPQNSPSPRPPLILLIFANSISVLLNHLFGLFSFKSAK